MRVVDGKLPQWISFLDDSVSRFSNESVFEFLFTFIFELSNIGSIFLHHFHGDLYWVHRFAVFVGHPVESLMCLIYLNGGGLVVFKDPLI